jgi:Na+-transporting methylmalonyl-CoA/oxaloacetate decarboxylase gamma subunit
VSLIFGVYVSLVGVAVVFVTLLAVVAASEVLRKLLSKRVEDAKGGDRTLEKVAAIAAVQYYMSQERSWPRMRAVAGPSRWSTIARIEALGLRRGRFK